MNDVMKQAAPQQIQLNQHQIAKACKSAHELLNDDERVTILPSMSLSGDLVIVNSILSALVTGESVLITSVMAQEYEALKKAAETTSGNDED